MSSSLPVQPAPQRIEVNFNVEIDASGNVNVFNAAAPQVSNVIVAEYNLPVDALYNPESNQGLLELWEPSDDQGNIKVQLANTDRTASDGLDFTNAYQASAKALVTGLERVLCDSFDCSNALPFSGYTNAVEYYKQRDFGRVALATYAHYLFGHVDATAAITNDMEFVQNMLSLTSAGDSESASVRYAAYNDAKKSAVQSSNVQEWDISKSGADANLAIRLVHTLVRKGLSNDEPTAVPIVSDVNSQDTSSLANIVAQVVGQDASRLMNVDNSQRTLDQHMLLRFYVGDVIYMNIKLATPNVNIGAKNQLVSKAALENMFVESNFTLKITLGEPSTPGGSTQRVFTSVVPDHDHNGNSIPLLSLSMNPQYFKFNFTAPSSSLNVFVKTNGTCELSAILGLYQSNSTINLMSSSININSGVSMFQSYILRFNSNLNNLTAVPNITLNSLVPGSVYSIIIVTNYNTADTVVPDIALAIEHNSNNVPLTYVAYSLNYNNL